VLDLDLQAMALIAASAINIFISNVGETAMKSMWMALTNEGMRSAIVACALMMAGTAIAGDTKVTLSGAEETPAVTTDATGSGIISVAADKSVSGSVTTKGVVGTAAHIHLAAPGQKGPPIITLTQTADGVWTVPAGSTLTDEQYASYKAGNLYVNVHSAANKGGEIRGQLKP
jgi:hypothetical protein